MRQRLSMPVSRDDGNFFRRVLRSVLAFESTNVVEKVAKRPRQEPSGGEIALSERARGLLKTLIEHHIRDGQPVGSKILARNAGFELSPATVRNVMADLEALGLVSSPHTSAGRVPTNRGYRVFIDNLLTVKAPTEEEVRRIRGELTGGATVNELLATASTLLSKVSKMAGVVMVPRREFAALRRVEFLPLSEKRVLAILVINEREVENRILQTGRDFSESELQKAGNYLNSIISGRDLRAVRSALLNEMRQVKESVNELMQSALDVADQVFDKRGGKHDYVLAGQTNLMHFAELSNVDKLRMLFEAFNEKNELLHLLDECMNAETMQIFIGEESGYAALDTCSVVTAPYEVDGKVLGVLGVIGPTRMAYERVIPLVDVTAKMLGAILNSKD